LKIDIIRRGLKIISDNRGIASAELMFVTLMFLIIAGSLINLTSSAMNRTETGTLGEVRMIGERIARTVNTVHLNGNGYSINLTMPDNINYSAVVNSTNNTASVKMQYGANNITIRLIPTNVQSVIMNNGQRYKVYNDNGTIRFSAI